MLAEVIGGLLRQRDRPHLDHGSVRQYVPFMHDGRRVVMLTDKTAVRAIQAGASLSFQVDRVRDRFAARLTWHKPSAIGLAV